MYADAWRIGTMASPQLRASQRANRKLRIRLPPVLTHRIAAHLDTMCIVNKPVENAIGQRRVADLLVPARDRQLRCQDGRAHLIAILGDLPEIPALGFGQRSHRPVVDYQNINTSQSS